MTALMIDLETLSTDFNAVILSIGMAVFDPYTKDVFSSIEIKPTIEDQVVLRRVIDDSTMAWWGKQSEEAISAAFTDQDRLSFKDAMEVAYHYSWNHDTIWANGAAFDIVVMETAFKQTLTDKTNPIPWPYYTVRDTRTAYEMAGVSLKSRIHKTKTTHNAVEDAIHQVAVLQEAFEKLGIRRS